MSALRAVAIASALSVAALGGVACEPSEPAATAPAQSPAVRASASSPQSRSQPSAGGAGNAAFSGARNAARGAGEVREPEPFTREQRLLDAARRGDRATAERALELGVPIGTRDDLGRSVVALVALDAGDLELIEFFVEKGAAADEPDVQGRAAVSFAAANGNVAIVRYLAGKGAALDRPDWQERTPLFHASLADHAAVVAFLLDRGANVNARDRFGDTPLIGACAKGNTATAKLLIERGADASLRDQEGRTARERTAPGVAPCQSLPQR